jgi:UrcA family protein
MSNTTPTRALPLALAAAMLMLTPAAVLAAEQSDASASSVRLTRINRAPDTGAEARQVQRQLAAAALDVCGASDLSVRTYKRAIARTSCYRQAYSQAAAQISWPSDQRATQVAPN